MSHNNRIDINTASSTLRISEFRFDELMLENNCLIVINSVGQKTISIDEFKKIAYSEKIKEYQTEDLYENLKKYENFEKKNEIGNIQKKIEDAITSYKENLNIFERVHSKYIKQYNILNEETPLVAFFIIFARIISLLKMTISCLEKNYLSAFILFRPIDEAVALAEYFIFSNDTDEGKKHLVEWFRENISPPNWVCRNFLKQHSMNTFSDSRKDLFDNDLQRQLYNQKSKPIHFTINPILSDFNSEIQNNEIVSVGFDYGESTNNVEIFGIVKFFESSIWTSIQGFLICALGRVSLSEEDIESLYKIHSKSLKKAYERNPTMLVN